MAIQFGVWAQFISGLQAAGVSGRAGLLIHRDGLERDAPVSAVDDKEFGLAALGFVLNLEYLSASHSRMAMT